MLSKTGIMLFLLLLSLPCYARFYIGAGAGPDITDFNQNAYIKAPNTDAKDTTHLAGKGYFGSIFAGYGDCYKQFYLAGEVNINYSSDEFHLSNSEFFHKTFSTTRYKMRSAFGLSFLPGYLFSDTFLFFIRLGFANGNFKISTSDASLANIDRRLTGFRYGIGIKKDFTRQISGRMEYSQTNYGTTHFFVVPNPSATKRTSIAPSTNQVEFALIYHFC